MICIYRMAVCLESLYVDLLFFLFLLLSDHAKNGAR